jgi:hypothetical protein
MMSGSFAPARASTTNAKALRAGALESNNHSVDWYRCVGAAVTVTTGPIDDSALNGGEAMI